MLLTEIAKSVILEGKASSFLKFYEELKRGYNPDNAILFDCLTILKEYYESYFRDWYDKYPDKRMEDRELLPHFKKRLQEINIALESDNVKRKIIAIDNGINQWHIDYPVAYHLQMSAEAASDDDDITSPANIEISQWYQVEQLLSKLGKRPSKSPYKRVLSKKPRGSGLYE